MIVQRFFFTCMATTFLFVSVAHCSWFSRFAPRGNLQAAASKVSTNFSKCKRGIFGGLAGSPIGFVAGAFYSHRQRQDSNNPKTCRNGQNSLKGLFLASAIGSYVGGGLVGLGSWIATLGTSTILFIRKMNRRS